MTLEACGIHNGQFKSRKMLRDRDFKKLCVMRDKAKISVIEGARNRDIFL